MLTSGKESSAGVVEDYAKIREITRDVLDRFVEPGWQTRSHQHLTFRSNHFNLRRLDDLLELPIDLTALESLDVSENSLRDLAPLEGSSAHLREKRCAQGIGVFSSLQVLKAKKNMLSNFNANLPGLKELDLSYNEFDSLPVLVGFPKLEVLVLSHNKMHGSFLALEQVRLLKKIDISNNRFAQGPSQLAEELKCMDHFFALVLKIKDNPLCMCFPQYQELCLQKLPSLKRLDDLQDMQNSRELAAKLKFNLRRCDDIALQNSHRPGRAIQKSSQETPEAQQQTSGRRFAEVARFLSRALANPLEAHVCVAGITRVTHDMYKTAQEKAKDLELIEIEMMKASQSPQDQIEQIIGDAYVLFARTEDSHQCSLILRAIAKLSIVDITFGGGGHAGVEKTNIGHRSIELLERIASEKPQFEDEIIGMVMELIILPIAKNDEEKEKLDNLPHLLCILSKFNSPKISTALKPVAKMLALHFCKGSDMGVAESKAPVREEISLLIMRLTESEENVEAMLEATGSLDERSLPMVAIAALAAVDTQRLSPSFQHGQTWDADQERMLRSNEVTFSIVRNLAKTRLDPISRVLQAKSLHVSVLRKLVSIFGDRIPSQPHQQDAGRANLDQPLMHAVPIITCILDILDELIQSNPRVCEELVERMDSHNRELDGFFLQYVLAAPRKAAQEADPDFTYPSILAISLRIIHFLLTTYNTKEARRRNAIIASLVESAEEARNRRGSAIKPNEPCGGIAHMVTLVHLCDDKSFLFSKAWNAVVAERSGKNGENQHSAQARLLTLGEPRMMRLLLAIINLMTFFTEVGDSDDELYDKAKHVVDSKREDLMLKMILVRNEDIKVAALQCLRAAGPEKTSAEEVSQLIALLEVKKEDLAYSLSYLEKIILQLHRLLEFDTGKIGSGTWALRSQQSTYCVDSVVCVLVKAARFVASMGKERKLQLMLLSACTAFLKSSSHIHDWRLGVLRAKSVTHSVVAALQAERSLNLKEPDISVERTWPGRAVEVLLLTFSGPDRPVARGRVAFRILTRLADVLLGFSDMQDLPSCPPRGQTVLENIIEKLARLELEPWDEVAFERRRDQMDDIEKDDWKTQQTLFGTSNGLERVFVFLDGLFESESDKQTCRVQETSCISASSEWVEEASKCVMDLEKALEDVGAGDGEDQAIKDGSDSEEGSAGEVVSDAPKLSFAHRNLSGEDWDFEDLQQTQVERVGGVMSILATLRWDEFRNWSSVLDFGNGPAQNNIVIANQGNTNSLVFEIYSGTKSQRVILPGVLEKGKMMQFLFTVSHTGVMRISHDGEVVGESRPEFVTQLGRMNFLYVGKSCWEQRANFKGRIEDLKVWVGKCFEWEDVVEYKESNGQVQSLDRRLVLQTLLSVEIDRGFHLCQPEAPKVSGTGNLLKSALDSKDFSDEIFSTGPNDVEGPMNAGLPLAATLRCCFALVKMPATTKVKGDIVASLRDKTTVARLLTLLRLTGPFSCCCAMKFFRLMSLVLELDGVEPDVDILATYDMLMAYAAEVSTRSVRAMKQTENEKLAKRGKDTAEAIMVLADVICSSLPYCLFSEEHENHKSAYLSFCFTRLVQQQFVRDMAQIELYAYQPDSRLSELIQSVIVKTIMHLAHDGKASMMQLLCTELLSSNVNMGPAILSELLEELKRSQESERLEALLAANAYGSEKINFEESNLGRTVASARVEAFLNQARLPVANSSHETPCLNCVMTNKSLYLSDVTVFGYPDSHTGVVKEWELGQLLRLIRGHVPQGLYLSFSKNKDSNDGEDIVALVFHREKDREKFLSKLQNLKIVPLQEDTLLEQALKKLLPRGFDMAVFSHTEGYFFVDQNAIRLFVFAQEQIHEFIVNMSRWIPNPDRPAIEDSPEEAARSKILSAQDMLSVGIWNEVRAALVTVANEPRAIKELDQVAFFPDQRPKIEYTFRSGVTSSIVFFDDSTMDSWREFLQKVLKADDGKGGWSRIANGGEAPLHVHHHHDHHVAGGESRS